MEQSQECERVLQRMLAYFEVEIALTLEQVVLLEQLAMESAAMTLEPAWVLAEN